MMSPVFFSHIFYFIHAQFAGLVQYSRMRHFGKIDFLLENLKWQTILHVFHQKFIPQR